MIGKLRRRMTLLVAAVILLVTAGLVISINYMNWRGISARAEEALDILAENKGLRPNVKINAEGVPPDGNPEDGPEMENEKNGLRDRNRREGGIMGQPPRMDNELARLSNYYVISLSEQGTPESWRSDRSDLYSDELVADMTETILKDGRKSGRIGTQFFRLLEDDAERLVIVLDERLEIMSAQQVLRDTLLIASIAGILLCAAAYILIRMLTNPVQEAFDRQKQFVWDASHELKTPLAVISSNAEVLEGEIGQNENLGYIRSEVKRTDALIRNLLTLARMDRNKVSADLKEIDLGRTVLEVALPFESTAFEQGRHFDIQTEDGVRVNGDRDMLQQLTVILLSNALKYSDEGGSITLSVRRGRRDGGEICVANTGDGIAPEDMDRIFDRFYRGDSSHNRETEGFGLGLSIAKNIVDAHKGKISVSSEAGGETVFRVRIP